MVRRRAGPAAHGKPSGSVAKYMTEQRCPRGAIPEGQTMGSAQSACMASRHPRRCCRIDRGRSRRAHGTVPIGEEPQLLGRALPRQQQECRCREAGTNDEGQRVATLAHGRVRMGSGDEGWIVLPSSISATASSYGQEARGGGCCAFACSPDSQDVEHRHSLSKGGRRDGVRGLSAEVRASPPQGSCSSRLHRPGGAIDRIRVSLFGTSR
jgi:hypothetical protein